MKDNNAPSVDGLAGSKIRVGIVNYLNTKPLIYGLEKEPVSEMIELIGAYPSKLAQMLNDDEIDIGLIPVAAILGITQLSYHWQLLYRNRR